VKIGEQDLAGHVLSDMCRDGYLCPGAMVQTAGMPSHGQHSALDAWMALLAGPGPWRATHPEHRAWIVLLTIAEVIALLGTAGSAIRTISIADTVGGTVAASLAVGAVVLLCVHVIVSQTSQWLTGRVWPSLLVRSSLLSLLVLSLLASGRRWDLLWSSALAIAMGIDIAATCTELGWKAQPIVWYRSFLKSGFHLGMVVAATGFAVLSKGGSLDTIVPIFFTMHVWIGLAFATVWTVNAQYLRDVSERTDALAQVVENERRARAHWLHDNVCADLRLVSMRIETAQVDRNETLAMLQQFDHQIRLRQLDELFAAGSVTVAELLQPYIRRCQTNNAEVTALPSFEEASRAVPTAAAQLLSRAASTLTSNALNAGATEVGIATETRAGYVTLRVDDNGPGLPADPFIPGRGLWNLRSDLPPGSISVGTSPLGGTHVTVSVPLDARRQ
jgi:signal transduction histidine kinase